MEESVEGVLAALAAQDYLADEGLATAVFLAGALSRPLLLEGDAGVGKTEVARAMARHLDVPLLRVQCYEGIDASQALYEWDYPRQLLHLRAAEAAGAPIDEDDLYSERFLVRRPLLAAIDHDGTPPVLLIDEVDRADDEFEAFLLEVLSEFAVTIPELGVIRATEPPFVVLTSNRTRDVHDALKRRCLYHWIDHPDFAREVEIIRRRAPAVPAALAVEVAGAVATLRELDLVKVPGVAESVDWAAALARLGRDSVDAEAIATTLGVVLKYREDQQRVREEGLATVVAGAQSARSGR
jgi:MoxR-like ATPase